MTCDEEFIESICENELQIKILSVLRDSTISRSERIKILVELIKRGEGVD